MKGQTLVEVLVALGVAIVVMTAITTAVLTSLNNSQYSKLQNQATQYAQQGMEMMLSYRDAKSLTHVSSNFCMPKSCSPSNDFAGCIETPSCTAKIDNNFQRSVNISPDTNCNGLKKVSVTVTWNDGKCRGTELCHKVNVTSCMADTLRSTL